VFISTGPSSCQIDSRHRSSTRHDRDQQSCQKNAK
jgi:hypothetical protein